MNESCGSGYKEEEVRGVHTECGKVETQRREAYGTGVVEDRVFEERSIYICKLVCKVPRMIWWQRFSLAQAMETQ